MKKSFLAFLMASGAAARGAELDRAKLADVRPRMRRFVERRQTLDLKVTPGRID